MRLRGRPLGSTELAGLGVGPEAGAGWWVLLQAVVFEDLAGYVALTCLELRRPRREGGYPEVLDSAGLMSKAGDRIRTGDVQLGKLAFYP